MISNGKLITKASVATGSAFLQNVSRFRSCWRPSSSVGVDPASAVDVVIPEHARADVTAEPAEREAK
jgi:hypothetical protein